MDKHEKNIGGYTFDTQVISAMNNGKISSVVNKLIQSKLAEEGLEINAEIWSVLFCLWDKSGITQSELCKRTMNSKPSMSRIIQKMEEKGLIHREECNSDRRSVFIYLTEKGKRLEKISNEASTQLIEKALKDITPKEMSITQSVIRRVLVNLGE